MDRVDREGDLLDEKCRLQCLCLVLLFTFSLLHFPLDLNAGFFIFNLFQRIMLICGIWQQVGIHLTISHVR